MRSSNLCWWTSRSVSDYARLAVVEKAYDPANVLRDNLSIRPEGDEL
ncbi:BBE domain-containing protein [Kitasatospora sp. NPDC058184]